MSFSLWRTKPAFSESDLTPGERIYQVGAHWVVTDQGVPTQAQIDAVINAPRTPSLTVEELAETLKAKGVLSQIDLDAARRPPR